MKIQHLVLDEDTHKALTTRKEKTGVTVKDIGNSALRAALSIPTKEELIVAKLVETGLVTYNDHAQAVSAAEAQIREAQRKAIEASRPTPGSKSVVVGSWVVREVFRSEDDSFGVFVHRARDTEKVAAPLHYHVESHAWAVVVRGKVLARTEQGERIVGVHEWTYYPPGVAHSSAPLTKNTCVVGIVSPPECFGPGESPDPRAKAGSRPRRPKSNR